MGNYRFRLSDMMPNAWFYKLKDMGKSRNTTNSSSLSLHQTKKKQLSNTYQQPQFTDHRHSYYFNSETIKPADKLYNSPINPKSSDVHFASDPPRKSSKRKSSKRRGRRSIKAATSSSSSSTKLVSSSVSAGCSCRATLDSVWTKTDNDTTEGSTPDYSPSPPDTSPESRFHVLDVSDQDIPSWSSSCSCRVSSSATDIIMDVDNSKKSSNLDGFHALQLPPILTKPAKFNDMVSEIKKRPVAVEKPVNRGTSSVMLEGKTTVTSRYLSVKEESIKTTVKEEKISRPIRRISANSPGLKIRSNSPRISCKKIQAGRKSVSSTTTNTKTRRKNISESFAIVKSSFDPQRDFRESMVEMIVENNIRASKDLEELLACYLSLNSNEYHDIIVKVFEQIWFDLTDIQL